MAMFDNFGTRNGCPLFKKLWAIRVFKVKCFDDASARSGSKDKPKSIRDVFEIRNHSLFTRLDMFLGLGLTADGELVTLIYIRSIYLQME